MSLPPRTPEQRAEALAKAKAVREERAVLRAALREGRLTAVEVLDDDESAAWRATVWWLVQSLPGVGDVRAARLLAAAGIPEEIHRSRRVSGLGAHQRAKLRELLAA